MTRNPITSYAEFSVPFPAEREIWLAPSPSAWRAVHLSKVRAPDPVYNSLRDMLMKPDRLNLLSGDADFTFATSIFVHGIGALVWDHRKLASITPDHPDDPTAQLWLQTRRQDLERLLSAVLARTPRPPAVLTLLASFLQLALHASLDDLQRFVVSDNHSPRLAAWHPTRAARAAAWHAAQVLRAARAVPPYQLRGFDSVCVYHAALALWVYGKLLPPACGAAEPEIRLDGPPGPETEAWVAQV
ncbi:putative c2h2 type zinc finger domain containing protein [Neofusicoccum parvum UCRNP2]|uniref:Putative c2h2 type zinc finger domain containing protein n=1 Tax=Botryosphaeria parva (strain UCR-NP2) TaxID=1287680 RepID=R1EIM0_BOTPV|nr:putative c2h2 type zinc finger domain containing protein [Neofusicoccum parvum UCRNP2]